MAQVSALGSAASCTSQGTSHASTLPAGTTHGSPARRCLEALDTTRGNTPGVQSTVTTTSAAYDRPSPGPRLLCKHTKVQPRRQTSISPPAKSRLASGVASLYRPHRLRSHRPADLPSPLLCTPVRRAGTSRLPYDTASSPRLEPPPPSPSPWPLPPCEGPASCPLPAQARPHPTICSPLFLLGRLSKLRASGTSYLCWGLPLRDLPPRCSPRDAWFGPCPRGRPSRTWCCGVPTREHTHRHSSHRKGVGFPSPRMWAGLWDTFLTTGMRRR